MPDPKARGPIAEPTKTVTGGPPGRWWWPQRLIEREPTLRNALLSLIEPDARGDRRLSLRWTCKSTRKLAAELTRQGIRDRPGRSHPSRPGSTLGVRAVTRPRRLPGSKVTFAPLAMESRAGVGRNGTVQTPSESPTLNSAS